MHSDIFARHLRQCDRVKADARTISKPSGKLSRAKSACDRCASAKIKCDSQQPCRHCKRKSLSCAYTRQGYADPYDSFRIRPRSEELSATRDQQGPARSTSFTENEAPSTRSSRSSLQRTAPSHHNPDPIEAQDLAMTEAEYDFNILAAAPTDEYLSLNHLSFSNVHDMMYMPADFEFDPMFDFSFETNGPSFQPEEMNASQSALLDCPSNSDPTKQCKNFSLIILYGTTTDG